MGDGSGTIHLASAGKNVAFGIGNYRITEADKIGFGGMKQKFRQNIAAIETLRRIEEENRTATPAEQSVLVKYVGWGGLSAAFARLPEGAGKPSTQLAELLTDEEIKSARATTLNAHYTSPVVIRAMYQAAQRLGFQGGQILEPACGIGHFIGLMPRGCCINLRLPALKLIR